MPLPQGESPHPTCALLPSRLVPHAPVCPHTCSGTQLTGTCEALAGEQLPRSLAQRLSLLPQEIGKNPLALLRLAPILIVAAALPAMLAPLLRGPPQVPEPRCGVGDV
jgi:hypothetical protein